MTQTTGLFYLATKTEFICDARRWAQNAGIKGEPDCGFDRAKVAQQRPRNVQRSIGKVTG